MPGDALLPSLLLQPLVENAVHHGIEPNQAPGEIRVSIVKSGDRVRVEIANPLPDAPLHPPWQSHGIVERASASTSPSTSKASSRPRARTGSSA